MLRERPAQAGQQVLQPASARLGIGHRALLWQRACCVLFHTTPCCAPHTKLQGRLAAAVLASALARPPGLRASVASTDLCFPMVGLGKCTAGEACPYAHSSEEAQLFAQWSKAQEVPAQRAGQVRLSVRQQGCHWDSVCGPHAAPGHALCKASSRGSALDFVARESGDGVASPTTHFESQTTDAGREPGAPH